MTAVITQKNILDATGQSFQMNVLDLSGLGGSTSSGPFVPIHQVATEGYKPTYSVASIDNVPAAAPTVVVTLTTNGIKRARILTIVIGGLATTAGQLPFLLVRRSAANTGGTAATVATAGANEQADGAPTLTIKAYTANPTGLGAQVAIHRARKLFMNLATAQPDRISWDFTRDNGKGLVLASASDILAINCNGATLPAGARFDVEITWVEET